jgi:hypothetical protein
LPNDKRKPELLFPFFRFRIMKQDMDNVKKCSKCGGEFPLDQFYKHRPECKDCRNAATAKWKKNNPEKSMAIGAKWYKNNPEKARAKNAKWHRDNPEKARALSTKWAKNNPEKVKATRDEWKKNNRDKCRAASAKWRKNNPGYMAKYHQERRANDIDYKLKTSFTNRIGKSIKSNKQCKHSTDLLGCTPRYAHEHLERQFKEGMTWDNYGYYGWHIDHIIPLSFFDFTDYEQQKRAWHYTNLQPLWAEENFKKGKKIIEMQLILQ